MQKYQRHVLKVKEVISCSRAFFQIICFFSFKNISRQPKKETFLNYIAEIRRLDNNRRQILNRICKIRWSERDLAYVGFYIALPLIVEALEIINGTHAEMESFKKKYREGWDYKTKWGATLLLNAVTGAWC